MSLRLNRRDRWDLGEGPLMSPIARPAFVATGGPLVGSSPRRFLGFAPG